MERSGRAWWWAFGALEVAAVPLLLLCGRGWWFFADDWDFLAARTGGNLGDLFRAHYEHWTTLPVVAYRLLWLAVGIRSYVPYQALVVVTHLVAAALLCVVMRRAGVRPWLATLLASVFVFFGAGAENILIAFQVTFVGAFVLGLAQLLLADHDGPLGRRDALGVLAGLGALMCSGVGIAMAAIVGLAVLLRRGWRIALVHTVPLAVAYGVWRAVAPKGITTVNRSQSVSQVLRFLVAGIEAAFGRLGQRPVVGLALLVLLVAGLVAVVRGGGLAPLRGRYAVPFALLAGVLLFLVLTGVYRAGQPAQFVHSTAVGPERARTSRYVYLSAAMLLPALGIAADALVARRRALAVPVAVLLLLGVPGNVHDLRTYTKAGAKERAVLRADILGAPRLPIARELPRATAPAHFYGLTLGWLLDSLPSGRIPAPGPRSPADVADQTFALALGPGFLPVRSHCERLRAPVVRVLAKGQRVTLAQGLATIRLLVPGGESVEEPFVAHTLAARAGPLRLRFTPASAAPRLCISPA